MEAVPFQRPNERAMIPAVVALLAVVPACAVQPSVVESEAGSARVLAGTAERAAQVARWADGYHARIREVLPATRDRRVEIRVERSIESKRFGRLPETIPGFTDEESGTIHVHETSDCLEHTICHELVHALLDEAWSTLPIVLEEGLCERVSIELVGGCADRSRAPLFVGAAQILAAAAGEPLRGALDLSFDAPDGRRLEKRVDAAFPPEYPASLSPRAALAESRHSIGARPGGASPIARLKVNAYHYGLGAWLIDRIHERGGSVATLLELCERAAREGHAAIPADQVLDAAGLDSDDSKWLPHLLGSVTENHLRGIVEHTGNLLARATADWLLSVANATGAPIDDALPRLRARFSLAGAPTELRLEDDAEFRGAVAREMRVGSPGA